MSNQQDISCCLRNIMVWPDDLQQTTGSHLSLHKTNELDLSLQLRHVIVISG